MPASPVSLHSDLIASGLVWQADRLARPRQKGWPSGYPALDEELPDAGWPRAGIIELISDYPGIGELQLLLPMLLHAQNTPPARWIALVGAPWLPYAPSLAAEGLDLSKLLLISPHDHHELVWANRQALASGACHAVLTWSRRIDTTALRRLQLAAEDAGTPLFVYRPGTALHQASPASLRMRLEARSDGLSVLITKRRGPPPKAPVHLPVLPELRGVPGYHALDRAVSSRPVLAGTHPRTS